MKRVLSRSRSRLLLGLMSVLMSTLTADVSHARSPSYRLSRNLAAHEARVRSMEQQMGQTSLPTWIKRAPARILASAKREAARCGDNVVFQKDTSPSHRNRITFGNAEDVTVHASSTFESQPSYGLALARQGLKVINRQPKEPGLFGDGINTRSSEQIEIHSKPQGWALGIESVTHTKSRMHKKTTGWWRWKTLLDRQFQTSFVPVGDGAWLMKRVYQANEVDPKTGTVKHAGQEQKRYYLIGADGHRQPLTPDRYHAIQRRALGN